MVCSRCILHHPHELQSGKYPSFLAEFHWGMPPLLVISTPSSARITVLLDKQRWLRPKWYVFSLYLYRVGHLNLNVKCLFVSNTLDYIAALIRTCCACRQQDGVWSARERSGAIKPLNYSHTSEKNEKEPGSHTPGQSWEKKDSETFTCFNLNVQV